ncbi:MAG: threonine--tRNA ligase [Candidatus Diapherotrites archaeon]|jgi:threonyl-tRNA synthetase|uniref:Threonine--tRNA ligase n=1 Tax=Candidatus Iainarchaeum sp. TaxID=3101447 RepID=A0A8T5GFJ5_9ARCH|nr:threonine--tRNA ligase [Candidatus Diapherotrites archaeon]MBT7240899.1 threonine--tRNA ligase [Candidatus Diapherotrites archaeon]
MDKSKENMEAFWHSAAHVFAEAVVEIYPTAKIAIGPPIEQGFHYDFELDKKLKENDLKQIEKKMKEIIRRKEDMKQEKVSIKKAKEMFKDNKYKIEMIEDLEKKGEKEISIFTNGKFTDMCKGPHIKNLGEIKTVKLLKVSSAYWKGDEKNTQLTRVYGIAFPSNDELKAWKEARANAEANDHNKIGREQNIFMTHELVGQGLPLLMPRGTKIYQILTRWIEDEEEKRGYVYTKTPYMAKSDLYKVSGHWDHYKEGMFILGDEKKEGELLALRPMTCPYQFLIYKNGVKSYRDLPIRFGETSMLFRNESSGEMHGLTRVRQFTLAEGHLIVTPEQLEEEFKGVLDLINYIMETLGIKEDITYTFAKWDPKNEKGKYIDNPDAWEHSQEALKKILDDVGLKYSEEEGEAAFYGPKLDLQAKNVYGKEDTIITVQIDFALPERFDMTYIDKDGKKKRPYVIHRSSIGCYERTIAMLIEKYGGAFPTWLSPEQAIIIPVSENFSEYGKKVLGELKEKGIRAELDDRNETLGYRIREAQKLKAPYILVVGEKEVKDKTVAVRTRNGKQDILKIDKFIEKILKEIKEKK